VDARALGVHRNSLYKVLAGKRQSRSLQARYASLKAQQAKVTEAPARPTTSGRTRGRRCRVSGPAAKQPPEELSK